MSSNDLILLNQLLKQRITEIGPDLAESDFFEMFSAEQVLKVSRFAGGVMSAIRPRLAFVGRCNPGMGKENEQ
jgi:hypothetical protein